MSRTIETEYECYGCASMNHVHIRKPKPFEPTISHQKCEVCESSFNISFKLASEKGKIAYGFFSNSVKLTDMGKEKLKERNQTQVNSDLNTNEVEDANGTNEQHSVSP